MPTTHFAIFNELSAALPAGSLADAIRWLTGLLDVMKHAASLRLRQLRTRHDFRQLQLAVDARLDQVTLLLERDQRVLLYRLLQSPYLDELHEEQFLSYTVISVAGEPCPNAEGLLSAHIAGSVAISFDNDARWRVSRVSLGLEIDSSREPATVEVRHASHSNHMASHVRWASRRTLSEQELVPSNDNPLPNIKFSDQLVNGDWSEFYRATSSLGPNEKTAKVRELATEVAFINGYEYAQELSSRNSQRARATRQVFVSKFAPQGHALYLSTDFEKAAGAFEVCDRNGRHLGEWLFSGKKNGDADNSGGHDILV